MLVKMMEHKTGAYCTAECGCYFEYGAPSIEKGDHYKRKDGQYVLDVIHKKCKTCRGND